jgi:aryl-alcohol dehydrogenase-like predicted oxidoreductase
MRYRTLSHSNLSASVIGLGCMSMSGLYGKGNDEESIGVVHHAIDRGVNFLDSSDMYGAGHNEELLGKAIKGRRDKVLITTKFGQAKNPEGGGNIINGRPEYVVQACEASLKRLGVNEIDLYYQHRVDRSVPIEETVGAMQRLVEQGKVRAIGLCEAAPATIRRAHAVHPISAVQMEYSLLYRNPAEEALPTCRELGITFVTYSPLGRGFLTGAIQTQGDLTENDRRREHPRFQGDNFSRNLELVHRIEAIAKEKKCTPAQLALAWLLAQGADILPIPGTKHKNRVDENMGAMEVELSPQDVERISAAIPPGAAAGPRYPEPQLKAVYV